jgi:thiol-disulfide isomerase/thioredoxin
LWGRIGLLLVAAVTVFFVTRPSSSPAFVAEGPAVDAPPPGVLTELTADEFEGVLVGLRGRPVIVNVWASWCAPCRTETPLLERTSQAHRTDIVIIGVNSRDQRAGALAFMDEFDVTFTNIFDQSGEIRRRLGVRGFPSTYVFGADGKLRTTVVGGLTEQRLASIIADVTA